MSNETMTQRAKDAPLNGFTLTNAIREALGSASVCWNDTGEGRVFDPERAIEVADDLRGALAEFLRIAINQQSLDARADMADWEMVELILQAPAIGWPEDGE